MTDVPQMSSEGAIILSMERRATVSLRRPVDVLI